MFPRDINRSASYDIPASNIALIPVVYTDKTLPSLWCWGFVIASRGGSKAAPFVGMVLGMPRFFFGVWRL